jgi:glycosyltransferase involved in cell wall biosynthesis
MDRHSRECAKQIDAGGFDVLFATNCMDFAVPAIGRHLELPKVVYHAEPIRRLHEARPRLPWAALPAKTWSFWPPTELHRFLADSSSVLAQRLEVRDELESVCAFDLMLVNSSYSRETMLRIYGKDSRVCYLGIDTKLFKCNHSVREGYVVGLGGFQPHKKLETAIKALGVIPPELRPKLVWIGNLVDPEYRQEMVQLARHCEVELEARELVSDEELVECLNRAAMLVYTSRLEPFGFAPLEANACGTPVVAVAEGGVRETVQHGVNGLLVSDGDPGALGAAIQSLIENPRLARELGEAGLQQVKDRWSWHSSVDRVEGLLYETVQNGRSAKTGRLPTG